MAGAINGSPRSAAASRREIRGREKAPSKIPLLAS
jgi:hypothetical protein